MEPFDTVKIKKKKGVSGTAFNASGGNAFSMQLFFSEAAAGGVHSQTGGGG